MQNTDNFLLTILFGSTPKDVDKFFVYFQIVKELQTIYIKIGLNFSLLYYEPCAKKTSF